MWARGYYSETPATGRTPAGSSGRGDARRPSWSGRRDRSPAGRIQSSRRAGRPGSPWRTSVPLRRAAGRLPGPRHRWQRPVFTALTLVSLAASILAAAFAAMSLISIPKPYRPRPTPESRFSETKCERRKNHSKEDRPEQAIHLHGCKLLVALDTGGRVRHTGQCGPRFRGRCAGLLKGWIECRMRD